MLSKAVSAGGVLERKVREGGRATGANANMMCHNR